MAWRRYPAYRDSGVTWLGEVPDHWDIKHLGWLADLVVPMRDKPPEFDGDIPWIRIEDFNGKYIFDSKSEQRVSLETVKKMNLKIYPAGTVLCSCSCSMGSTAIVSRPLISNQTFIGVIPKNSLSSEFLYYLLGASSGHLQMMGSGAIQQYLSRENFSHLCIAIPSIAEQHAIAAFLDRETTHIDALLARKERLIALLQEKRAALISHAVTKGLDPLAPMKDSGIAWLGEVPASWQILKLRECGAIFGGVTPSMDDLSFWDGSIPWVTPKDMKKPVIADSQIRVTNKALEQTSLKIVPANSVLLVVRGMILAKRVPIARTGVPTTINQDMKAIVPEGNMVVSQK